MELDASAVERQLINGLLVGVTQEKDVFIDEFNC